MKYSIMFLHRKKDALFLYTGGKVGLLFFWEKDFIFSFGQKGYYSKWEKDNVLDEKSCNIFYVE